MTEAELRQVLILDRLYDHRPENPGDIPDVGDVLGSDYDPSDEELWRGALKTLDSLGLVELMETFGGLATSGVSITDLGRVEVEKIRKRRENPALRNAAARKAVLEFLYAQPGYRAMTVDGLLSSPHAQFEGDALGSADIDAALPYLTRKRLITGIRTGQLNTLVRLHLTDRGVDCVEQFGGSVADYVRNVEHGAANNTVNFHGPVTGSNVAWNSREITQTATTSTGVAGDELVSLIKAIKQALPVLGLDEADSARLLGQLDVVEGELESAEPDAGVVKSVLKRVLSKVGAVADSSLGLFLTAYAKDLMRKAGVPLE
ncbi:hypothetical protein [Luedemannella helvata]|uniref:Uncharacterized protein n=1 Tax=Luedemannella helvata TaxID=349315 RepID=A0ABN2KLW9_9ACTN